MENLNTQTEYYYKRLKYKEREFNRNSWLPEYFRPMIGNKKKVKIAELASGPVCTIGNQWPETEVQISCSDKYADQYHEMWRELGKKPIVPVVKQDMEHLIYPKDTFDIVHCVNALDHTPDPLKAIEEMRRVSKEWVYLRHAQYQRKHYGQHHAWDIVYEDGKCIFYGKDYSFELGGFDVRLEDDLVVCVTNEVY